MKSEVLVTFVDNKEKRVLLVEMSCPWVDNRLKKEGGKTEVWTSALGTD